jgi:hexokinase
MPRSVEEILQHADELAARFENCEPNPSEELDPTAVAALRSAAMERATAERHLLEAVRRARAARLSWSAIGALVGTSGEAARQRYSSKVA